MPFQDPPADDCLAGGGEIAALMRSIDWSATPLGPVASWSLALRTMVRVLLVNRFQLYLWWGPRYVQIYNDAARPILGAKHPRSLGQPAAECWSEIWHVIGPLIDTPFRGGPATWQEDIFLEINRYGTPEETHFTIAYSPVPDDSVPGGIGGVFGTVHEITDKVVGERRVVVLRDLGARAAEAKSVAEACATAARALAAHDKDIPFALIYLLDREGTHLELAAASGVAEGEAISPGVVGLDGEGRSEWPLAEVIASNAPRVVSNLATRFGRVPPGPWSDLPTSAVVLPIPSTRAHEPAGLFVAGVSARLRLDEQYRGFLELVAGQIGTAVGNARAYEEEKRRAEALAELDRAKTAFFSNVSHEFRTPLTLMLGPVEDALADPADPLPARQRERLETAHRSSLRLLKLVNTLLDFSRIEAGRVQAAYEPTDLAALTAELASNFRSACDKAGLRLVVDCPTLPEPVYVDRDMWEKVVLNLLSNAFKYTLEGEIAVHLRPAGGAAELTVRDTGTGIPADELPRIFERFHRVEGSRGRTHEGTGIGLALVQELVKLHGGSVRAESTPGIGSTFLVSVPTGTAHLPADRIGAARTLGSTAVGAGAFIEEALRWLPDQETSRSFPGSVGNAREAFPAEGPAPRSPTGAPEREGKAAPRPRVLWADDNADMRDYVRRLLGERYDVEAVPDGEAALAAARTRPPDLVLTDVMMPRLDGFGLLNALRADPATRAIPVILLSARAGEESRVEGLEAGADDYLVKPFSARELLARVGANLEMARVRREAGERVTYLMESIPDGLVVLDPEWRYTFVNAPAERLLGRPRSDLIGRCAWDVFPHAVGTDEERQLRRVASGQVTCEFQGHHAGWERWYENRAFPMPEGGVAVCFRDITERRRAEEALRQSEERFRGYFELGLIGMAITSPSKGCVEVNDEMCKILGYQRDELLTRTWAEITHPDDVAADLAQFNRVMAGEIDGYTLGKRWVSKDGRVIHSVISVKCVRLADGSVDYFVGLLQDVTERQRAEDVLRESEERFRNMADRAPVKIWVTDADGLCTYLNERWCRFTGTTPEQGLGNGWLESVNPDDRQPVWASFRAANEQRSAFNLEYRLRRYDGVYRWVIESAAARFGPAGEFLGYIGSVLDVTERKQAEEVVRASEQQLTADLAGMVRLQEVSTRLVHDGDPHPLLLEIVDAAIAITAADMGNVQLYDPASDTLRIVAARGFRPEDLRTFEVIRRGQATCGTALARGERVVVGDVTTSPIFVDKPILGAMLGAGIRAAQSTPLVARSGRLVGMLSTHYRTPRCPADRDLHILDLLARQAADWIERTQAEEQLKHAKEAAEAANRAKDEFLANVSHEIRTPFGAILGMTELVLDTPLTDEQRQCLETARSAAEGLLGLVDTLLDFEKIEAGKMELDAADFSLRAVVGDALRALAARAHQKGLELIFDVHPRIPDTLVGDSSRLRQVLLNLVGNAVKFTDRGEVLVSISTEEAGDGGQPASAVLRFAVTDTGIGIPPDGRDRIFRAFEQADSSTTRKHGGSGLGLTIAARLVALMGGSIALESEVGRGSTFAFTARFGRQPHPSVSADRPPAVLHNLPVLVVDDSATARQILDGWLRGWGMAPTGAGDAAAALDALTHGTADGRPFALVLLDARMPGTDALELASVIRERAGPSGTRIVLLTSGDRSEDPARLAGLSLDARLLKPVPPAELLDAIDRVMSRPSGAPPPALVPAVPAPPAVPLRILVAEDDELNARHLDRLLGRAGHRVRVAANGRDALALLGIAGPDAGVRTGPDFDVLLLDLHMPELDGFQVARAIRAREEADGGHLPVVALTARSRGEDRERCLRAGMDEFLSKPVKAAELFAAIDRAVPTGPRGGSVGAAGAARGDLLDPAVLLAACGGDPGGLLGLCQDLRAYAPTRVAELRDALRDGDAPRSREAAHKLCGLLSAFSTTAGALAAEVEDHAAADRLDEAGPLVERLKTMTLDLTAQVSELTVEALRDRAAGG